MMALSMVQPWATLAIHGVKQYETRCWNTRHRGVLAIHASKKMTNETFDLFIHPNYRPLFESLGYRTPYDLPRGVLIGTVELTCSTRFEDFDDSNLSDQDRSLGNFSEGQWIWRLKNPRLWPTAFPAFRGCNGIFPLPEEVVHGRS